MTKFGVVYSIGTTKLYTKSINGISGCSMVFMYIPQIKIKNIMSAVTFKLGITTTHIIYIIIHKC